MLIYNQQKWINEWIHLSNYRVACKIWAWDDDENIGYGYFHIMVDDEVCQKG